MNTVQVSRTIPLRPQWAWHYLCDVLHWDLFLPFVTEVRRLEGERFELGWVDGRSCQMKLVLREPTERLEWVTTDPRFVGGAFIVEKLGFRTGVTVQLDLDDQPGHTLEAIQTELEAGLERLVVHLSDREPIEHGPEPVRVVTGLPSLKVDDVSRLPRIR
jgi:Polyketide cyclase / dehydrase and lipid transport